MLPFEIFDDEALMLWIVSALREAHRRGLTSVDCGDLHDDDLNQARVAELRRMVSTRREDDPVR
ncbi:hypothetical protein [Alsobacter sp. SYSU BS001988]